MTYLYGSILWGIACLFVGTIGAYFQTLRRADSDGYDYLQWALVLAGMLWVLGMLFALALQLPGLWDSVVVTVTGDAG